MTRLSVIAIAGSHIGERSIWLVEARPCTHGGGHAILVPIEEVLPRRFRFHCSREETNHIIARVQDRRDQVVHLRRAREMLGSLCAVRLRFPPCLATVAVRLAEEEDRYLARFILKLRLEGVVFLQVISNLPSFQSDLCKHSQRFCCLKRNS